MNGADVALAAIVGGLLVLERKTFGQFMLSRPIVVAPLVAAIVGDASAGLAVGIPLELFFLGTASYGASTPDLETLPALFAGTLAALATPAGASVPAPAALALSVFVALPLAPLGRLLEARLEADNALLVDRAEAALAAGHPGRATRQALGRVALVVLLGAGVTVLGALLGPLVLRLDAMLPAAVHRGLAFAWPLFVGVCAALALRTIRTPGGAVLSALAAVTVFVVFALATWLVQ